MAKMSEIFSGTDSKSRIFIVLGTILGIFGVVFIGSKMLGSNKAAGQAKVAGAPTLQSVPGGDVTPEYYRALMKANANSAKQAEITGASAVPTLVSTPSQDQITTTSTNSTNCIVTCPGDEAADVSNEINTLLKDGKLSAADANQLLALAKSNVPVSEYSAYLSQLVKQGKLTPDQARKLLTEYTKQHANASVAQSAQVMDGFIKSGKMSLEAANTLLALQKQNPTPAQYQAAIDQLVREGKLTPEAAAQLMAQYNQQLREDAAQEGGAQLRQMAQNGEITAVVADDLAALQKRNVSLGAYSAELDRLVADGKMTPAAAAKLLSQYRAQRTGAPAGVAITSASIDPASALAYMVKTGAVQPEVANDLLALQKSNASVSDYKDELNKLVAAGKLSPDAATKLLTQYSASQGSPTGGGSIDPAAGMAYMVKTGAVPADVANDLLSLQKSNASVGDYKAALNKLVAAGKLPPEAAASLLAQYSASVGAPAGGGSIDPAAALSYMVKTGTVSAGVASDLLGLQKSNASVGDYKAELNKLVAAGKLPPEAAASLLAQYSASVGAPAGGGAIDPAAAMSYMVKTGAVSAAVASDLLGLQKSNVSPGEYKAELDKLVAAGKITPEIAAKLLTQYVGSPADAGTVDPAAALADLVKTGEVPSAVANQLLDLQKSNASAGEYKAALDQLVASGKLTPATAAKLLSQYSSALAGAAGADPAAALAAMVKTGAVQPEVASDLLGLQKSNASVGDYKAELDKLVAAGRLSPETAAKLLTQYSASVASAQSGTGLSPVDAASALADLVKSGAVQPEVASDLLGLQKSNASVGDYKAELDKLVAAGKLTPEMASQLSAQYAAAHSGVGPAGALNALVATAAAKNMADIGDLESSGQLSPIAATQLREMQKQNVSAQDYANSVDALVRAGKLTPDAADKLKADYSKLQGLRTQAKNLIDLQANDAPVSAYKTELSQSVVKKVIDPQTAGSLLQQYEALSAPPPLPVAPAAGNAPAFATNVPGAQDFAALQQRVAADQANRPVAVASTNVGGDAAQFEAEVAAADAEAARAHQQRIQDLTAQMTTQAQSLVAAWAPPQMSFKGGSDSSKKSVGAEGLSQAQSNNKNDKADKAATAEVAPLIKAGTILFAVLTTAVDSDYPDTPVMATIVSGEFKGATLLGKLALASGQDKVSLSFTLMNRDDWIKTKNITAFAIDPDTARTVMASSVDNHYMLRYGTLFASSFVTGYANGISQSGSTSTSGIFGTSSTHPQLSPGEKIAVGLGQVGTTFGTALQSYVNTPATVKVNSGVGLGILFMADVVATSPAALTPATQSGSH